MTDLACFTVDEAQPKDAPAIATIHLTSRRRAMPYLRRPHTDDETRDFFAQVVGDRRAHDASAVPLRYPTAVIGSRREE